MSTIKIIKACILFVLAYIFSVIIGMQLYFIIDTEVIILIWILISMIFFGLYIMIYKYLLTSFSDGIIMISLAIGFVIVIIASILFSMSLTEHDFIPDITVIVFIPSYLFNLLIIAFIYISKKLYYYRKNKK